jgi:uncharacterized protein (TIGR03663 family)
MLFIGSRGVKPMGMKSSVCRERADQLSLEDDFRFSPATWRVCSWATVIAGAILRLLQLSLKPLHHDEGVNGLFLVRLIREGIYRFDAANYHGPTLYYFALALARLRHLLGGPLDLGVTGLRITPALFSIATIWLILLLRRPLGDRPTLFAAGLVALSPGAVYFARDFIHESLLVFFTLALLVAVLQWLQTQHALYLFLAATSGAVLVATKETAIISIAVLLLAWLGASFWVRARGHWHPVAVVQDISALHRYELAMSLLFFIFVVILFFSSFFSNMQGIADSARALRIWGHTGLVSNRHPWYSYALWLMKSETVILVLGSVGFAFALWRGCRRFEIFASLWAFGTLAAYSLLPYKTPWLTINTVIPMGIVAGLGLNFIFVRIEKAVRLSTRAMVAFVLLPVTLPTYQCISLNWFRYDDESHPYVYSQTRRGFLSLVREIEESAHRFGTDKQTSITVTSPDYWPLPWYLRDYPRTGYYGTIIKPHEQIVIASGLQDPVLLLLLDSGYRRVASYPLRPGVNLVCYVREQTVGLSGR